MALSFLSRQTMKGDRATWKTTLRSHTSAAGLIKIILRLFQFIMGIVVIGLYAQDLDRARKAGKYVDSKWVWSTTCGALGALCAILLALPFATWRAFFVDYLLFLFYLIAFGIFGKMYINEDPEGNKGIQRMKNGVWVLLTNMLLWLITAVYGSILFWRAKNARTVHTGQASMSQV